MKITIAPTELDNKISQFQHPTVTIEIHGDDHSLSELIDTLIRPALLGWGFHADTVDQYLNQD